MRNFFLCADGVVSSPAGASVCCAVGRNQIRLHRNFLTPPSPARSPRPTRVHLPGVQLAPPSHYYLLLLVGHDAKCETRWSSKRGIASYECGDRLEKRFLTLFSGAGSNGSRLILFSSFCVAVPTTRKTCCMYDGNRFRGPRPEKGVATSSATLYPSRVGGVDIANHRLYSQAAQGTFFVHIYSSVDYLLHHSIDCCAVC